MNYLRKIEEAVESQMHEETNGLMTDDFSKCYELLTVLDNKLNMYERIRFCGPQKVKFKKTLYYSNKEMNPEFAEFVDTKYYIEDEDGDIYLKEGTVCIARIIKSTQWVEICFEDNKSSFDLALDDESEYDDYLGLV